MGADAANAKVREAAEIAVFRARELEWAGAYEVGALAGRAAADVAGGEGEVSWVAWGKLRFRGALEPFDWIGRNVRSIEWE